MKRHLVIFMKAPVMGQVKRRLEVDIGALSALSFYRRCLGGLLLVISRDLTKNRDLRLYLAVTPDRFARPGAWRFSSHSSFSRRPRFITQGHGDLGERMARVFKELPRGPAVLVGGDIPGLSSSHIEAAFDALRSHDAVFGPAKDGGYYLVGVRDRALARTLFEDVRWSSPYALSDTLANLGDRRRAALISPLEDVDNVADFERWREENQGDLS